MNEFNLKSGNATPFKLMGASPAKANVARDASMNPTGPRGPKGGFATGSTKGSYGEKVTTMPVTRKTSTGKDFPTGETKVEVKRSNRYTKDGKTYSKVRGPSAEQEVETSTVGPKGKQKGKTKVVHSNPSGAESSFWNPTKSVERDDSNPFSGNREYNPKTRKIK